MDKDSTMSRVFYLHPWFQVTVHHRQSISKWVIENVIFRTKDFKCTDQYNVLQSP